MKSKTRNVLLLIPLFVSLLLVGVNSVLNKGVSFCEHCWPSPDLNISDFAKNWHMEKEFAEYVLFQLPTSIIHTYTLNVDVGVLLRRIGIENPSLSTVLNFVIGVAFLLCIIKLLCIYIAEDKSSVARLSEHKAMLSVLVVLICLYDCSRHDVFDFVVGIVVFVVIVVLVKWGASSTSGGPLKGIIDDIKNIKISDGSDRIYGLECSNCWNHYESHNRHEPCPKCGGHASVKYTNLC